MQYFNKRTVKQAVIRAQRQVFQEISRINIITRQDRRQRITGGNTIQNQTQKEQTLGKPSEMLDRAKQNLAIIASPNTVYIGGGNGEHLVVISPKHRIKGNGVGNGNGHHMQES